MLDNTTRLYISPLTPDLLPKVLGLSLTSVAENISYHDIQTFPENNFGYVELPSADAERLRKKLAGAIFRGCKMKVEEARPKKRRRVEQDEEPGQADTGSESHKRSGKQRKSAHKDVIPGHELNQDRKVQRGWTEPKKEKANKKTGKTSQKQASKYTEDPELLFRTKIPSNKADLTAKTSKKSKKAKYGAEEATVHEFKNTTTQPSFLKSGAPAGSNNLEYVDGKGWVDQSGDVVEGEPTSVRRAKEQLETQRNKATTKAARKPVAVSASDAKAAITSTSSASTSSEPSLDSSSDDDSDDESAQSVGVSSPHSQEDALGDVEANDGELHPLESLFKKPQMPASQDVAKPSLEISTGFSFFGGASDDIEDEPEVPLTPFSRDTRSRGLRSAAPTPDTAHPSRFNSYDSARFLGEDTSEEGGGEESNASPAKEVREQSPKHLRSSSKTNASGGPSDFEKLFWEKRGDNNRAWKGRRRAVLKEKRHRENRARRPKNW